MCAAVFMWARWLSKHQRKENAISWFCVFLATKLCLLGNSFPWALGILWYVAKRQEKRYEVDTTSKSAVLGGVDLPHHPKIPFSPERNGIQYTQLVPSFFQCQTDRAAGWFHETQPRLQCAWWIKLLWRNSYSSAKLLSDFSEVWS